MRLNQKRVILCGRAASGKDYLRKLLQEDDLKYQISYTTRPPRQNEVHGIDYLFLDEQSFKNMINNDEFYEYVVFNGWYYGTSRKQFNELNSMFIMTPAGLAHLSNKDREDSLVIYLDIPEDVRRSRMLLRNDADNTERRINADNIDFKDFENYDIIIEDPNFTMELINDSLKNYSSVLEGLMKHIHTYTL